jgi:hypothetical protein
MELNFFGSATWQPGQSWSVGFPFDSDGPDLVLDAKFEFSSPDGFVLNGGTVVPPMTFALAALLLVPEQTADFNGNGDVDADDLDDWRNAFGVNDMGDADSDGDSDGADFLAWQCQLGSGQAVTPATGGVPEPASGLLGGPFALAVLLRGRRLQPSVASRQGSPCRKTPRVSRAA